MMVDVLTVLNTLDEDYFPYPIHHQPAFVLKHRVVQCRRVQVLLHFSYIYHAIACQLLKLGIINVRTVYGKDIAQSIL